MGFSNDVIALIKAGKREEALAIVERFKKENRLSPTRITTDKAGSPVFYRGKRRVIQNASGEWELAPKIRSSKMKAAGDSEI